MKLNRRLFCQSAVATGFASAIPAPLLLAQTSATSRSLPAEIQAARLSGGTTTVERAALGELAESLQGSLLLNGDFGYDGARRIWNGMHDRFPAMIVRAADARDVSNAVTFARERELLVCVKGGGHSWPGQSVADDALMIDLGLMGGVTVDPGRRRARAAGGALIYALDNATQSHGLATTTGVVSHTGLGGFTLGGGFGRLNRRFGLTIDNVTSAQLVTADGQIRRVSADENADLFWAIRGGGGNFGVVTEFEYALHQVQPIVLGGDIFWPLDQARELLEFYAEWSTGLSKEMYVGPEIVPTPDGAGMIGMDVCYCGEIAAGERELAPLRQFGTPLSDGVGPTPYVTLQARLDGAFHSGIRSYIKSGMVDDFTPGLIDAMVESFDPQRGIIVGFHTAGGAISEVGIGATAWPHRRAQTMILAVSAWEDPAQDDMFISANRAQWAALETHTSGYYENIQAEVAGVRGNFGPAYERLVAVKNEFDPMNLFRRNSNVAPTV
jgi:hypothetical protein